MKKLIYTLAVIAALGTISFAGEPIPKPESMSQQEWNARVLGALEELEENPSFLSMLDGNKDTAPQIQEAVRIYKERHKK